MFKQISLQRNPIARGHGDVFAQLTAILRSAAYRHQKQVPTNRSISLLRTGLFCRNRSTSFFTKTKQWLRGLVDCLESRCVMDLGRRI